MSAAEVRTIIAKIMGRDVVEDTDDPIKACGADSLDMLELTQALEDRFGYHIPTMKLTSCAPWAISFAGTSSTLRWSRAAR
jgi:acyl carrier protein